MEQLGRLFINFGWGKGGGGRVRHCLACGVSGAPGVCLECAWRFCLGLCEWVSLRLWSVRVCVCLSGSGASPCLSVSVCLGRSLSGEYVVFLRLCLCPGLGASLECVPSFGGLGTICVRVSGSRVQRWWVWRKVDRECVSHCVSVCVPDAPINSLCLDSLAQPGWDRGCK